MRLLPRSLFGRLLGIATLTTVAALAFAAFTIGHVLERFVIRGLDQQLDAEVGMLTRAVRPDGTLDQSRIVNLPLFEQGDGWGWRIESPRGQWRSGDTADAPPPLQPPLPVLSAKHPDNGPDTPHPGDGRARSGEPVHFREISVTTAAGPVVVMASGPRRVALAPLREAMVPLLASLALLGAALALATALQLHFGLRPLRALRAAVVDVRAGRARHIPSAQPAELAPLAAELNAMIDQNASQLEHARRHVANLAHGLKTPLAALSVKLAETKSDPDGSLAALVSKIDGQVRHHLGRARAASPGGGLRPRTAVEPALGDLLTVFERVHAARKIDADVSVEKGLAASIDAQDLDEMLGNLLDNAWRYAKTRVMIVARRIEAAIEIAIDDDGPGLSEQAIAEALLPGRRLDESGDGHGFGLPIAQELAELNGGTMSLQQSRLGGLRAVLSLPA
jgi:signal transduction histidine kinase